MPQFEQMVKETNMFQKIKCFFGSHRVQFLGMELPFYQQVLLKCDCCHKYGLWHYGINCEYWVRDIQEFPEIVTNHIKEHNL